VRAEALVLAAEDHAMRRLLALTLVCFGLVAAPAAAVCPSVGGNWAGTGPFAVTTQASGAGHTIYRPAQLGSQGCTTHPVVVWGNGTGAAPSNYDALLRHWASHGFIVAAADTRMSGTGREMLAGLDWLTTQNQTAGSPFAGRVDTANVAASGHSQGGGGAVNAGGDPRVDVTVPIQGNPFVPVENLHGPAFFLAGQNDFVVPASGVRGAYERAAHVVAVFGNLAGANHLTPTGNGGGYRGPATAWLRFHLMGDEQARGLFFGPSCTYCGSSAWTEFLRNANAQAVPGP
jgi:Chlorophyllase enzyme